MSKDEIIHSIALTIVGPHNPLPDTSKFTLETLQEIRLNAEYTDKNHVIRAATEIYKKFVDTQDDLSGRPDRPEHWTDLMALAYIANKFERNPESIANFCLLFIRGQWQQIKIHFPDFVCFVNSIQKISRPDKFSECSEAIRQEVKYEIENRSTK